MIPSLYENYLGADRHLVYRMKKDEEDVHN
jgi:hypothetical protein